jgi:tetratricopeptide (TPR) repeat protein
LTLGSTQVEHRAVQRQVIIASLSLSCLLLSSQAFAQQATADEPRLEEARAQYRNGVQAFQRNRFGEATVAFERSFRARPHPATLYNAAEARMRAGDTEGALEQLRELLAMTSPAPDADLAARARALAAQMGSRDLQPAAPRVESTPCPTCPTCRTEAPTCPPPPPPEVVTTRIGGGAWALGGAALVFSAVGAGFLGVAIDNAATYTDAGASVDLQTRLRDQGETYRTVGIVGLALGVGAAVGAVWMFTHPQERRVAAPVARLDFGLSPGGLSVAGTF